MIDELTVPLIGTLETDPDAIPRGFIHRDPDILNIHQQNTLTEMKVKMMDFDIEYLAKHPQVEALVRLLIKELIIHKPYYVREFIKGILSRDDLESEVAKIVAAKKISLNRRHTRHYFSHVKTWQDKANRVNEPKEQDEPFWPEPRPFRVETRRDKMEYCHPHYIKIPYVLFPGEYLKPKEPVFERRKYPQFHSKSYARLVLQNYKDVWGDPITGVPPPLNDEELHTACSLLKQKSQKEMTNEELIQCCIRCRRTRLKSYLYAMNKKQFNDPLKKYPSYTILKNSLKLRVANRFLERTLDALRRKDIRTINCAWVPEVGMINNVDRELIKFEARFLQHQPLAEINQFKSPIPGMRFKEQGTFRLLLPLGDLKVKGKDELNPRIAVFMSDSRDKRKGKIKVPTTDLHGNIIDHSEISVSVRSVEPSEQDVDSCIRLGERKIGSAPVYDEKHLLLEQTRVQKRESAQELSTALGVPERQSSAESNKKELIRDLQSKIAGSLLSIKSCENPAKELLHNLSMGEDSLQALARESFGDKIENYLHPENRIEKDKEAPPLPAYVVDPYMQLLVDSKKLTKHFKKKNRASAMTSSMK